MPFFHVRITQKSNPTHDSVELDLSENDVEETIARPYQDGEEFLCGGDVIDPFDVQTIRINETELPSRDLLPKIRAERDEDYIEGISDEWYVTEKGSDVTRRFVKQPPRKITNKKIFISHGGETLALAKTGGFVQALGFETVVAKREASTGRALDDLVEQKMSECACVIILATADDKVKDYFQPRPNVIHEIGLAQEKLKDRVIYLKEKGCELPSNIRPKVWEDFSQDNMESAFEKIGKELHAFGFI